MRVHSGSIAHVVALGMLSCAAAAYAGDLAATADYRAAVLVESVRAHQEAFQTIADENDGHRGAGSSGYNLSAQYVGELLDSYGYLVTHQTIWYIGFFDITPPVLVLNSDPPLQFPPNAADGVFTSEYSGSGDVTALVTPVDVVIPAGPNANTSTSGCEAADFAGFPAGNIALIQRGTCTFRVKADNAVAAGASGVILFNEGQPGRTDAFFTTLSAPVLSLPTVMTSYINGELLAHLAGKVTVRLSVDAATEKRKADNVFAERPGCEDSVVMIGAHLDSVYAGPGINDNGSGCAAVLELAIQMAKLEIQPARTVRFAWWAFEEQGLIGSFEYVESLPPEELERIDLYLNLDMIGSPNFVRFVYDGDGSSGFFFPPGSEEIEEIFRDYFGVLGLPVEELALTASDNYPFALAGVPVGGLFTGAGGIKTPEEAVLYGGTAGIAHDPCYHQPCDTYDNVSITALDEMSDAAAHALLTLAQDPAFCRTRELESGEGGFRGVSTFEFTACMAGPEEAIQGCCVCAQFNAGAGVDLSDYAVWQSNFGTGP